jgi:AcrR family transcriptional regulator
VPVSANSRRKRVPALPPEDRRAALIQVTIPLLEEHGVGVTTRQIADAAGVAEGTIFGVFPDKASLLRAAIIEAFAPDQAVTAIRASREIPDLRQRIADIVTMLASGTARRIRMMMAVRTLVVGGPDEAPSLPAKLAESRDRILHAVAEALEPDARRLRLSPIATARVVMAMVFASQSGNLGGNDEDPISSTELSALLLDGLLASSVTPDQGDPPC